MRMLRWARGKTRLDHVRNVDMERGTHVPDGGIPQREDVEMVRPCRPYKGEIKMRHEKDIADGGRRKEKSRQTKAEMTRPGQRRYGQKRDDD